MILLTQIIATLLLLLLLAGPVCVLSMVSTSPINKQNIKPSFTSLIDLSDKLLGPLLPQNPPPAPGPLSSQDNSCILYDYYDPTLSSFNVNGVVDVGNGRLSVTSTIYSLIALRAMGTPLSSMVWTCTEVFESEWRLDDFFQSPLIGDLFLECVMEGVGEEIVEGMGDKGKEKIGELLYRCIDERPRRRDGANQRYSSYISFQITSTLCQLFKIVSPSFPSPPLPLHSPVTLSEIALAVERCYETSSDEVSRQIGWWACGDLREFDTTRLAYSLVSYVMAGEVLSKANPVDISKASAETTTTTVTGVKVNKKLVAKAVEIFMGCQMQVGMDEKKKYHRKTTSGILTSLPHAQDGENGQKAIQFF